jgi:hypothetical protein
MEDSFPQKGGNSHPWDAARWRAAEPLQPINLVVAGVAQEAAYAVDDGER